MASNYYNDYYNTSDNKLIRGMTFKIIDEPENIENCLEIILNAVKFKVLVRHSSQSLIIRNNVYKSKIIEHPLFKQGVIISLMIYLPINLFNKLIAKMRVDKDFRLKLAGSSLGVTPCTLQDVNDIVNSVL